MHLYPFLVVRRPRLHNMDDDKQTQVCEGDFDDEDDDWDNGGGEQNESIADDDDYGEDVLHFIADYVDEFAIEMSSPDFWENVRDALPRPVDEEWFDSLVDDYYLQCGLVPPRSRPSCDDDGCVVSDAWLAELQRQPQPEQRSSAWFHFRHSVITASSIGKLFATEAQRNSVIYEKCKPLVLTESAAATLPNFDSPLHWGQKYEPLSVLLYEHWFGTKVGTFGCLQHPTCPCIAASPDGINLGPRRHGRMLEIKNIVNRDITGVPLEAYWIQMQIQMEVCNLDACDFLETRFREFPTEAAFLKAAADDDKVDHLGVMLLFLSATQPEYRYEIMPLKLPLEQRHDWIRSTQDAMRKDHKLALFETIYWYLDEYSCVLVDRNRRWFEAAKPVIEATWDTILLERANGYEHRAPKSKQPPAVVVVKL